MYTERCDHSKKIGGRATMDSKLEDQRSIIKFLLLGGEKPCNIFQRLQTSFSKTCMFRSTVYRWVKVKGGQDKPRPERPAEALTLSIKIAE